MPIADPRPDYRNFDVEVRRTASLFIKAAPQFFRKDFEDWLLNNYEIWLRFEAEANKIWSMGRTHYSARTILHWIRHETALQEKPNQLGLKINNNWSPDLARLYVCVHPDRDGFFEKRSGHSAVRDQ